MDLLAKKYPGIFQMERFLLMEVIDEDSQVKVYKCKDRKHNNQEIALKIIHFDHASTGVAIFKLLFQMKEIQRLHHPHIVKIHDFDSVNDYFYMVTEFIKGTTLRAFIQKEHSLSDNNKIIIATKILQGIEAVHEHNVLHLGLCPSKIMVSRDHEPKITDFGLLHFFRKDTVVTEQSFSDRPVYISPEQIRGDKVDERADIYAYGLIFYELLCGEFPFGESQLSSSISSHLKDNPINPHIIHDSINSDIEKIIMKCLKKDPENRYQNVTELMSDILTTFQSNAKSAVSFSDKTVLVVDDEPAILRTFSKMFEKIGLNVEIGRDGQQAVSKARELLPDLICLDIMMPKLTGLEAAKILLEDPKTKHIPIVILSAKTEDDYLVHSHEMGIKDYMTKPITFKELKKRVSHWLKSEI